MNRKGQVQVGIGELLIVFITVLVGLILLVGSANQIGISTTLSVKVNESQTAPANGSTLAFTAFKELRSVVIFNFTNETAASGSKLMELNKDFKVLNNVVVDGAEISQIQVFTDNYSASSGGEWNVSYTGVPDTFITSGGTRAVVSLIILFMALAIVIVTLSPTLRNKILDLKN